MSLESEQNYINEIKQLKQKIKELEEKIKELQDININDQENIQELKRQI